MSKKTYDFIASTEAVNAYGYRILTDGIDTEQYMRNPVVLYMHNRNAYGATGDEVIGRTVALRKEQGNLIATVEFDEANAFAQKIAGKVERGFIKMCSLGADVVTTSTDSHYLLPGQTLETVTQCKMVELSIVDIGANDQSLRLSRNGAPVQLKKINQTTINNMSELKSIALSIGLSADSNEATVLQEVNGLKLAKENAEKEAKIWQEKYAALQKMEASKLVDKAVALSLIPEALKEAQLSAFAQDYELQSITLSKLIAEKETALEQERQSNEVKNFVTLSKRTGNASKEDCFDYLQKHNVAELKRLQQEEPERYASLVKDYQAGKRYNG